MRKPATCELAFHEFRKALFCCEELLAQFDARFSLLFGERSEPHAERPGKLNFEIGKPW